MMTIISLLLIQVVMELTYVHTHVLKIYLCGVA